MTKTIFVTFAACALVACGGGSASGGATRQGSHPDQGTAAPHIECGASTGHHGGGCNGPTSGGAASADGAAAETTTTTTTTTTTP